MIREIQSPDLAHVRSILEGWMRDEPDGSVRHDDVEHAIGIMTQSLTSRDSNYLVIENEKGNVVGVAGFTAVGIDPQLVEDAKHPVEIVNVYIARDKRGQGIGTTLVDEIESRLKAAGYDTLLVVSGSRNRQYGYPFWDGRYGMRFRNDTDYFGPDAERVVWRKGLR